MGHLSLEVIISYFEDQTKGKETDEVEAHLVTCERCHEIYTGLRAIEETLNRSYQATVQKISETMRSLLSVDQIGKKMLETALDAMFINSGSIMLLNPEQQVYEFLSSMERRDSSDGLTPWISNSTEMDKKLEANDLLIQKIAARKREVTIYDIQEDPLFEQDREAYKKAFERLRATLIVPLIYEDRLIGLILMGNKRSGKFYRREDINLLKTLANYGAVAIQNAQLHQARIDALEHSRIELERLNRAKSKALDHLSHELRTPLALVQGNIRLIKRNTQMQSPPSVKEDVFESLERNLDRLSTIQQETDKIIRSYKKVERKPSFEIISLFPFVEEILEKVNQEASHREIDYHLDGEKDLHVAVDPGILEDVIKGLLKNAIENTPDEGMIRIVLEQKAQWLLLKVQDFGIGITKENQRHLFDGLFHTLDTELYTSKKPYDFGAGGKGLDLLRIKTYGQRFGFDTSVGSQRCIYLPTDRDLCPGKISGCPHCKTSKDCLSSGGSTFCVTFPISEKIPT